MIVESSGSLGKALLAKPLSTLKALNDAQAAEVDAYLQLEDIWASPEKQQQAISKAYSAFAFPPTSLLQQAFAC